MVDSWKLIVVYQPGELTAIYIQTDDLIHKFVTGSAQQAMHRNTGWYQEQSLVEVAQAILTDSIETDLIKAFYAVEGGGLT